MDQLPKYNFSWVLQTYLRVYFPCEYLRGSPKYFFVCLRVSLCHLSSLLRTYTKSYSCHYGFRRFLLTKLKLIAWTYFYFLAVCFRRTDKKFCVIKFELFISIMKSSLFWLYVLAMSRTRIRVNLHSIVVWMSRNSLFEGDVKSGQMVCSFKN